MEWSVAVTRAGAEPALDVRSESDDDMVHELNQLLEDHAPAVSFKADRYTVRIAVSAPEINKAVDYALSEIFSASARAGMPDWPVVDVHLTEWDEFSRQLDEPTYPNVVGVSELAEMLGVSRQRASELARVESFPSPFVELASGPVWLEPNVRRFCETWVRKPGRPRKEDGDKALEVMKLTKMAARSALDERKRADKT